MTIFSQRRRQLGMPIRTLVRLSGVPVATVNRILKNPLHVRFQHVAAVARVLGMDMLSFSEQPVEQLLRERARERARYVARLVQGTQGLEAAALDPTGYERLVEVTTDTLLAGEKRKLWDE